ncbi:MAG: DUF3267 domain-containing protein [Anaerolineae bacterium]|nr:DUF3267 domain-containing protein [Anaerolineae bacterium]
MAEFTNAPENYAEVLYWRLTHNKQALLIINILGIPLLIVTGFLFTAWANLWHSSISGNVNMRIGLGIILSIIAVVVLHELTHGLAMQRFGAKPKYGILWTGLAFYATAPGYAFRRNNYLVIALAPLVALSVLSCILLALPQNGAFVAMIVVFATVNAAGAIGDLWITGIVLRYPPQAYIVDEKDGIRVLMPANAG